MAGGDLKRASGRLRRRDAPGPEGLVLAHPGGESPWLLTAEGAAVHPAERLAVLADVHLGYEWARGSGGDMVPRHSLAETLAKLARLLERGPIERIVVAGDLTESAAPCPRTARDLGELKGWLDDRGVELIPIRGNHDPAASRSWAESMMVDGWTIRHGHRKLGDGRSISGHHHPVLRAESVTAPCFLVGAGTIVLPAFSPNAAGVDAISVASTLDESRREGLRCIAGLDGVVLDFGPLDALRARLGRG